MIHSNEQQSVNQKRLQHFLPHHQLVKNIQLSFIHLISILNVETEEMRLAASIIDKAKRTIEVSSGRQI